jgi:hypothetical protein
MIVSSLVCERTITDQDHVNVGYKEGKHKPVLVWTGFVTFTETPAVDNHMYSYMRSNQ